MQNTEFLLIPHERIGVLIGQKGKTKTYIAKTTHTKIEIDSNSGEVEIQMKGNPIGFLKAMNIVKAIGRGFSPENAFKLLQDETTLEIIELREILGKSENRMKAKKGRVIGSKGEAREEIEKETGTKISVYGKTISIIGKPEGVEKAKSAIEMLLGGATHNMAYESLKRHYNNQKFEL
jgi:ribosomal RNA assembly protein